MADLERSILASGCAQDGIEDTIADLATGLATDLDSMMLPVIALELAMAKELGVLSGDTEKQRYESFFERDGTWHERVRALLLRYHFLDVLIDRYVTSTATALVDSVAALATDLDDIRRTFLKPGETTLVASGLLGDGDRHKRGRRPLWMRFDRGTTIVYKPVDFSTYRFFHRFTRALGLPSLYDCFVPRVLCKDGFGWMEHVEHRDCRDEDEISLFFRRFGALLAIAESLNLVDGHSENVIASGAYPVLVDLETALHNHSLGDFTPNVFHTLLVEKVPDDGRLYSALMAPPGPRRNVFGAFPASDQTPDLSVSYGRPVPHGPSNVPTLKGRYVTVFRHVEELVAGYRATYDLISSCLVGERSRISFLDAAKTCRPRAVVRSTAYYSYVLRRLEQPEGMMCVEAAETVVRSSLATTGRFWESEVHDLLHYDVPYFYQKTTERHLYHWDGSCEEENLFPATAIDSLQESWRKRSTHHRDENIARIRETLHEAERRHVD